jgi:hypothetical protein
VKPGWSLPSLLLIALTLVCMPDTARTEDAASLRAQLENACRYGAGEKDILREFGPPSTALIAKLRILLTSEHDPGVRRCTVQVLTAMGDRPPQTLAMLLRDKEPGVREAARVALSGSGREAVEPVGEVLRTAPCYSDSARFAARVLGEIGDGQGAVHLADVLIRNRGGCFPKEVGFDALKEIPGPESVRMLLVMTSYHQLAVGSYSVLIGRSNRALRSDMLALMRDSSNSPDMRISYALKFNDIAGTAAAKESLLEFFEELAADEFVPQGTREAVVQFHTAFLKGGKGLYRKPLDRDGAVVSARLLRQEMERFSRDYDREKRRKERDVERIRSTRRAEEKEREAERKREEGLDGVNVAFKGLSRGEKKKLVEERNLLFKDPSQLSRREERRLEELRKEREEKFAPQLQQQTGNYQGETWYNQAEINAYWQTRYSLWQTNRASGDTSFP